MKMLKEFRPSLIFLGKFLAIYFIGNIVYGLYVGSYGSMADDVTRATTIQTSQVLRAIGENTSATMNPYAATVFLKNGDRVVLNVFEGCNGVNVIIIFVAFVIAFGGPTRKMIWFLPMGIVVIHLCNLLRLLLLYFTARRYEQYFYFVHKYFFTAILYLIIFALWAVWIIRFNVKSNQEERQSGQSD